MKILAVDDSNTMRILIAKGLKEIGYSDVTLCESGALAMNVLNNVTYDLVLLDWHMPGINGFEILKFIKNSKHKDIPVIMLTTEQQKVNIVRAIENGAADYLIKPLNTARLKEKIDKIFGQKDSKASQSKTKSQLNEVSPVEADSQPLEEPPDIDLPEIDLSGLDLDD